MAKAEREKHFPLGPPRQRSRPSWARGGVATGRPRCILNTIVGRPAAELHEPFLKEHDKYDELNLLRGRFGVAILTRLLQADEPLELCRRPSKAPG